ncbi:putative sugar O-methyltransferase [Nisaea sp.]|uniref:putative sugar O-methyltransferase n=1 Tax=Nisaea sp. TaxID=2024842 RepID=UPI0032EFA547
MAQIPDDPDLLNLMMADLQAAEPIFQPTKYWRDYQDATLLYLKINGLESIRGRRDGAVTSFGCYESPLHPTRDGLSHIGFSSEEIDTVEAFLRVAANSPKKPILPLGLSIEDVFRARLALLDSKARERCSRARSIYEMDCSIVGGPKSYFEFRDKIYTQNMLLAFDAYIECMVDIDLEQVSTVVEIGAGIGQQVECLKKLHPHLTIIVIDIPPQLYVSHQYLRTVFPECSVSYRETRTGVPAFEPGGLYFLGNWQIDAIDPPGPTLLWNAKSFQEMSQPVVSRYADAFMKWSDWLHLRNLANGLEPQKIAKHDLESAVGRDFYESLFSPSFVQKADRPVSKSSTRDYRIMTWERK